MIKVRSFELKSLFDRKWGLVGTLKRWVFGFPSSFLKCKEKLSYNKHNVSLYDLKNRKQKVRSIGVEELLSLDVGVDALHLLDKILFLDVFNLE